MSHQTAAEEHSGTGSILHQVLASALRVRRVRTMDYQEPYYSTKNVTKRKVKSGALGFAVGTAAGTVVAAMRSGFTFGPPQVKAGAFLGFIIGVGGALRQQ